MYLDQRTKKYLKIFGLIAFVFILVGCTANLDSETGELIAERAINESTKWSLDAGFFDFILIIPIAKGILFASNYLGIVGGVVAMTILINIIILPVMVKSTVSSQKLQMLQPEIEKIQLKYRGRTDEASQLRMNQEMTKVYEKNGVSMFGSLWSFITLPIMLAMWQAIQRLEPIYSTVFFGLNLGKYPLKMTMAGSPQYLIVVVIVGITQLFAVQITQILMKRNPKYKKSSTTDQTQMMNYFMVILIVWFSLQMPTAMSLYWITTNIITVIRTTYIQIFHIEKEYSANGNRKVDNSKGKNKKKKGSKK